MVCSLLNGLRGLHTEFNKVETVVNSEGKQYTRPQTPQVKLPYIFLVAWLALHYANLLMALTSEDPASLSYVQRSENSDWMCYYMSIVCRASRVIKIIRSTIASLNFLTAIMAIVFRTFED